MTDDEKRSLAQAIVTNPLYAEMFEERETQVFEELLNLPVWARKSKRDALILEIKVLRDVRRRLDFHAKYSAPRRRSAV